MRVAFSSYSGMDVGRDNGLVVDREYEPRAPYAFTGSVKKVVLDLKPAYQEAEKALHESVHQHLVAQSEHHTRTTVVFASQNGFCTDDVGMTVRRAHGQARR